MLCAAVLPFSDCRIFNALCRIAAVFFSGLFYSFAYILAYPAFFFSDFSLFVLCRCPLFFRSRILSPVRSFISTNTRIHAFSARIPFFAFLCPRSAPFSPSRIFFEPAPFVFRSVSSAFSSFCGTTALFRGRRLIGAERLVLFGRGIFIAAKRTKGMVGRIYCRVQPARRVPGNFRSICFPRKNKKKRKNFAALDGIKLREELRERAKRTK